MIPTADFLARSSILTWLGVGVLLAAAFWLFLRRGKFRTLFFVPLCWAPFVAGIYFREHGGNESSGFTISGVLFFALAIGGMLMDSFWSPYADDLADQEYLSQYKD